MLFHQPLPHIVSHQDLGLGEADVRELDMIKTKYKKTAAYGHFGNDARPADADFTWEVSKKLKV